VESPDIDFPEKINLTSGDIILLPSNARHRVKPVTKGLRQVLVIEWWNQPKNIQIGRQEPGQVLWYLNNPNFDKKRQEIREQNAKIEQELQQRQKKKNINKNNKNKINKIKNGNRGPQLQQMKRNRNRINNNNKEPALNIDQLLNFDINNVNRNINQLK